MIEVNSIDAMPGEAEILTLMATYMASRLFTKRQRRTLSVIIDVTRDVVREPVTRRMLAPQRSGLGTRPPKSFEMTVSTAAGLRDAAEVMAHELLHISQAVNGRLQITEKKKKINRKKVAVHVARWMGGKPITMDDLPWRQRPWEIEACGWQGQLVTECLMLTTGQSVDQPVQAPKRKQLALYPVRVPAPAPVSPVSQEPVFAPDVASSAPEPVAMEPVAMEPVVPSSVAAANAGKAIEANEASIDRLMDRVAPKTAPPDAEPVVEAPATPVAAEPVGGEVPAMPSDASEDELVAGLAADPAMAMDGNQGENGFGKQNGHVPVAHSATPDALFDAPVYSKPVVEVDVPGLDSPRSLQRDAIAKKLGELRKRGLTKAEIAGL